MKYKSKREPRAKQAEALAKMKGRDAFALLMAMRTGKTKVLTDDWGRTIQENGSSNLLLIAPGGVYRTWPPEMQKDLPIDAEFFLWESGKKTKAKELEKAFFMKERNKPRVLIINIEALSSIKEARELCLEFARQAPCSIVIDESVIIKNPSAKRTKFINRELGPLAMRRRILSGLPTPRSPLDLYSQFEFLDWRILGFKSYYAFRARYAVMRSVDFGGRQVQIVVGYRNIDDLWEKIEPYSFRCRLEDCYDLPPSQYMIREVKMTEDQARLYKEMKAFATAQLSNESHISATIVIAQMLRLHQILCGHVMDEEGKVHEISENRTAELIELLDDYDGKAIIWCAYDHDVRKVSEKLKQHFGEGSVARFWGGNVATREDEERRFKNDPDCRFQVATASAGGRGRTWDCADLVIYYSSTNNLDHRSQSEERPKGVGKTKSIAYIDLMVPDTVETKIIQALREKINMAAMITGDNYQEWLI